MRGRIVIKPDPLFANGQSVLLQQEVLRLPVQKGRVLSLSFS
jgi:hypothetical protein